MGPTRHVGVGLFTFFSVVYKDKVWVVYDLRQRKFVIQMTSIWKQVYCDGIMHKVYTLHTYCHGTYIKYTQCMYIAMASYIKYTHCMYIAMALYIKYTYCMYIAMESYIKYTHCSPDRYS